MIRSLLQRRSVQVHTTAAVIPSLVLLQHSLRRHPITFSASTSFIHQKRSACQIHHPTKLDQLRAKLRTFGQGHVELELNHAPGLALLTLYNPERHNALTGKMMAELADCVDLLQEATSSTFSSSSDAPLEIHSPQYLSCHPESQLVLKSAGQIITKIDRETIHLLNELVGLVVTGSNQKSYCAGLDLSAAKATLLTSQAGAEMSALMVSTLTRFLRLPLISIAAIEKAAIGGGAEMTTFCDHRCVADGAKVQFVQTQMGVVPGWGGVSRLLGIVPRSHALRLLAAAEPIRGGADALQSGFSQVTAPTGKAVEKATEYMQHYVWEHAPSAADTKGARRCVPAVRGMKQIISHGLDDNRIERVSELEKDLFRQLWGGPDNLARVANATSKKK
ncbi:enoyl CoA hydratase domain-containing protein 1 [Podila epigama]|nr:enoyl CoA hydratase domain-containing protein 1 [Podila epigama]